MAPLDLRVQAFGWVLRRLPRAGLGAPPPGDGTGSADGADRPDAASPAAGARPHDRGVTGRVPLLGAVLESLVTTVSGALFDTVSGTAAPGVALTNLTVPGPEENLAVRVYRPARPAAAPGPLIVHYHGGGWAPSRPGLADWLCSQVAKTVGAVVVSVD